jgi:hypothetical protein
MSDTVQEAATEDVGASQPANGADTASHDYEAEARTLGWRPKEQWRGDEKRWVDAETFVQRSQGWLPMVQQRNQEMSRDLAAAKSEITELRDIMAQQLDRQRRAEQIGYKRAMRELEQRKAEAISNADAAEVARVDQEIRDMGPEPAKEPSPPVRQATAQPQGQQADPVVVEWVQRNPWVTADPTAWDMAVSTLNRVQAAAPGAALNDHLSEVERRIKKLFVQEEPVQQTRERRADPPAVARSGNSGTRTSVQPRSFDAMPANVRAQYAKEVRALDGKGKPLTKEEFAEYYFEQFPEEAA